MLNSGPFFSSQNVAIFSGDISIFPFWGMSLCIVVMSMFVLLFFFHYKRMIKEQSFFIQDLVKPIALSATKGF